jgi:hypothetical protein
MRKDLISFYELGAPDNHRRWLDDIQRANNEWLEGCHSYIQWLFPNREPSPYNPEAPTLDDETIEVFRSRNDLKLEVKRSLETMIEFYQLDVDAPWWVTKKNHNYLRITRILNTLREFQMFEEACDFFDKLSTIYSNNKEIIGEVTFDFWEKAFTGEV